MSGILDPPSGTSFNADFLKSWSDTHVAKWLADIRCSVHADTFKGHDIRGDILLELDQDTLREMSISSVGDRLRILNAVKTLRLKCAPRIASPNVSLPHPRNLTLDGPSKQNGIQASHSRENSRDSNTRDQSPSSRATKRLDNNRPAPLVLAPNSSRPDLPRLIREPYSGDSARAASLIRPLPQPVNGSSPASASASSVASATRPALPPLPPVPRGQPPQPPTTRPTPRNLHPLAGARSRTPSQMDPSSYTTSPLHTAAPSQNLLTPLSSNRPAYGLPTDPRSGSSTLKPTIRSPSPLSSHPSPRPVNGSAHGRNISFGGVSSPMSSVPAAKLPPRPSTTGTTQHPYASAQPPLSGAALSPIVEAFQSPSSNPSSPAFTVGRGPFHPSSHTQQLSLDDLRRKLVKFILPDEGRSCVVDVADCAGGIEVMEKVLRKFDKVAARRKEDGPNIMSRIETDDGGLSIDGWCVYLESEDQCDNGKPLSEAELLAVCHGPPDSIKEQGLTLRRTGRTKRSKALARIFGEDPPIASPRTSSPTSPARNAFPFPPARQSTPGDELDADMSSTDYATTIGDDQRTNRSIKRASTISILSGLGVRDPEKALESPISPTQQASAKRPSKLRNFFGQRPPSELITTHLTEYFPFAEKKMLRTARHSMMLRASTHEYARVTRAIVQAELGHVNGQGVHDRQRKCDRRPAAGVDLDRDGNSVILTGDDVDKLSGIDSKPHLLPPVTFPTESLSESMEDLTGSRRLSRTSSNASKRTSFMTELRSKRDRSDTASLLTVDEITAEVENRRQSMAVDMGVEGAEDWTKVEPDIDDVTSLSEDTVFEDEEDEGEDETEEEDEMGRTMTSSGGTKWIKGALIGAGSFGKVYLGMDAVNGLLMAVKQVELPTGSAPNEERKKSMLSALEREIDLLKDLSHPNIVQYLYSSVDDDFLNIFLEYVPGGSVTALLRSYGAFEEPLVKNFGANVLVDNKGGIKISDFGISKRVDGNLLTGKRMNRPSLQGSVFWMAPEVVQQKTHTSAADIWSVGCLVVEMLTGEHPWAQLTQMQAIFKIGQSAKPTIPSDISADAADFLTKTFEIDHHARPSAGELLLQGWLAVKPGGVAGGGKGGAAKGIVPTIEVTS
ncbi:Pkinase-domain-containing protein [Boletus reticuloceps]|uniref:Pkinase-domain-containing protein n=1 Tax=Boletus reticuloceps TaxID=495285 RepID=A0A8I2YE08_9AGAM|nr:Pkinase-domain-containing protein [Boletus reticuloceps]